MTNQAPQLFKDRCLLVVQDLAREEGWELPTEELDALVEAILPFVHDVAYPDDAPDPDVRLIRRIARNYRLDGPMVQEMLAQGSLAGERIWTEWRAHFLSVARWKGLSPQDAEDLVQAVYLQTNKALGTFRFKSRLKTFFYSIFINCYKQWLRDTARRRGRVIPLAEGEGANGESLELVIADESPLPEAVAIEQVQDADLRTLIEAEIRKIISDVDFQVLYLYYVEETFIDEETGERENWTDKAIGEKWEMPLNTVTSKRHRAVKRLRNNPRLKEAFRELLGLDVEDLDA